MPAPRLRWTTRRTMLTVAVVAFVLAGALAWVRERHRAEVRFFLGQAAVFDRLERDFLGRAGKIEQGDRVAEIPGEPRERAARVVWSRDQARGFARNARFFRHVASLPGLLDDPGVQEYHARADR